MENVVPERTLSCRSLDLNGFASKSDLARGSSVLVRVTSWIVFSFLDKRNDPRASHELNTKLVTTEIES